MKFKVFLCQLSLLGLMPFIVVASNVGGVSGSNQFQITSDGSTTTYKIVSASITGEAIFTGSVDSVTDSNITFSTYLDENNNTTYPFFARGSFNRNVQVPKITSTTPSSGAIPIHFQAQILIMVVVLIVV